MNLHNNEAGRQVNNINYNSLNILLERDGKNLRIEHYR